MNQLSPNSGKISDRYRIKGKIGAGYHSEVFVAKDHDAEDTLVAIKNLNCDLIESVGPDLIETLETNLRQKTVILSN